jgi:hypothetical protein
MPYQASAELPRAYATSCRNTRRTSTAPRSTLPGGRATPAPTRRSCTGSPWAAKRSYVKVDGVWMPRR